MNIKVNGINIYYEIMGEGKPIILLNPNSVYTGLMRPIAKLIARDFKVYLVDRRCCGKSERNCELSYEESAKDIYELIKKLNLDKPYVLGCSGGASVALYLSIMYPDSISKLILCSGSARKINIPSESFFSKLPWYPGKRNSDRFWKLINESREIKKEELDTIKAQTLIVNGGKKDIIPIEEAKYLSENINNSKLIIFEKDNHCGYCKKEEWYYKLKDFLDEL